MFKVCRERGVEMRFTCAVIEGGIVNSSTGDGGGFLSRAAKVRTNPVVVVAERPEPRM